MANRKNVGAPIKEILEEEEEEEMRDVSMLNNKMIEI